MRISRAFLFSLVFPLSLFALPKGEEIQRGKVHFERQGDRLAIHAADGSIIGYQSFDVAQNERVEFVQPNIQARVLNRISSSTPSTVDGQITGNGQVYLVNPMGIVFGPNSIVDVGRLVAGAARIRDEDFIAKNDAFFDLQGDVINQGLLQGEEVHLIGTKIKNEGWIKTPDGFATLLSGNAVLIQEKKTHPQVAFDVESIAIGAMDFVGYAISQSGAISAKKVHIEGERVFIEGKIDATGDIGGTVHVLGDQIFLQGAQIDASGKTGGGEVLVGGNLQGEGSLRQSRKTFVDENCRIDVSAIEKGNGGTSAIWSKEISYFDGKILACGGLKGGDGGFVETSGKQALGGERGRVDARAPFGKTGDWLLDPLSIVIATAGAGTLMQAANCGDMATALTISNTTVNGALANVILCASATIVQNADAPINIAASGVGINFQSTGATTLNANVTTNGGAITATTGTSTILNNTIVNSGSGNLSLINAAVGVGGTGSTLQVSSGSLTLTGTTSLANNLTLISTGGTISTVNITGSTQNLTIDAGSTGTVSIGGNTNVNTLTVTNSLLTTFVGTTTATSVVLTNTATTIDFGLGVTFGSISTTTNPYLVVFETGGTVTNAATFFNTGGVQFGTALSGGNITFTGGLNTNQTGVTTSTNGTVSTTATPMALGPVVLLGNTTMNTSNGALTFNSTLTGAHNLTANTGTTAPLFTGAVSIGDVVGNVSLTINTTGLNSIFSSTLTTVGGFTSNDNVVFNNNVSIGGVVTLPSLTTNVIPLSTYNVAFLGGGSVTAFTQFLNTGTITFGSASHPTLSFTNGVNTASGPTSTTVQGTVQVTIATAPLTFGMTVFASGADALTTNNGLLTIGDTTLTGNATLTTGGANLTIASAIGAGNLTSSSGAMGITTIDALTCGVFTPSNSLSVTITGATTVATVNLGGMNNGQAVTFNGLANISTNLFTTPASYSVAFNAGGVVTPFVDFFNTGGVNLGNSSTSSIAFTNGLNSNHAGVATSTYGLIQATSGPMTFGPVTLAGNTSMRDTSNPILFAATINGAASLNIADATNTVTFSGVVGGTAPLFSLYAAGSTVFVAANITAIGGSISFGSPVVLLAPTTMTDTGGGIYFSSTINGGFGLTLNALSSGTVSIDGAIGGTTALTSLAVSAANDAYFGSSINTTGTAGSAGGDILVTAGGNIECSGNITAIGGANGFDGGDVIFSSSSGSVTVASIDVSGGGAGSPFPGGNAGEILLQPTSSFSSSKQLGLYPNGILNVYGTLTALGGSGASTGSPGTVSLSPAGRAKSLSVATIAGNPAGSNLIVNAGSLIIGPNEATTVLGNINFNLQTSAAVGDLIALNDIIINAPTIDLILHETGEILDNRGILYPNSRLHLISGDPTLNGHIITTGSGSSPKIADVQFSPQFFRQLLFYGNIILNFDRDFAPVSGIIDWVLRTDFWDSTPLVHQPSEKQMIALRIDQTIAFMPNLRPTWLAIEKRKGHPVETAIIKYAAEKKLQGALISLPEFQAYLKRSDSRAAKAYIGGIQTLIFGVKQKTASKTSDRYRALIPTKYGELETGQKPTEYFTNDILAFTKPPSLTSAQWRQLVLQ